MRRWRAAAAILPALAVAAVGARWWTRPEPVEDVGGVAGATIGRVYFGGPDRPAGALRDLLLARVRATPAGQSIDWATYYFLDPELARGLVEASRRGVRVRLVVEGDPRLSAANDATLAMLRRDGLNGGLTIRPAPGFPFGKIGGKLHAKIYAFSWPSPVALVGSFNPSGGVGEDMRAVIDEIGDQDRGHNMLVEIVAPGLVDALVRHVAALAQGHGAVGRFDGENNRVVHAGDTDLFFYPRLHPDVIERALGRLGPGDRLWAAISHLKGEGVDALEDAARRGARIRLIVHDTERRVPERAVERLHRAGIEVRRYRDPDRLPMHDKFFVVETEGRRTAYFGSLNFNRNSRLLNDELLVRSTDPSLAATLLRRFDDIDREVNGQPATARR